MISVYQIFVFIIIVVIGSFVQQYRKRKKQPPGYLGLPFVGEKPWHILKYFFPKLFPVVSLNQYFTDMKNKYGGIWSTDLGNRKIVVMASIDTINEAFVDNAKHFHGGKSTDLFQLITKKHGVVFNTGEIWDANRQLAIKALRDLGMGKRQLEPQINEEIHEMMENIEKSPTGYISCPDIFTEPISNINYQLLLNIKSKDIEGGYVTLVKHFHLMFNLHEANIIQFIPKIIPMKIIRKLVPQIDEFVKSKDYSLDFFDKLCRDRIKVEGEFSKPSCLFDYFWRYRYQDYPNIDYNEKLTDITQSIFDLYLGGIDTTIIIISFCCLLLGRHRDVQEDLRKEIQVLVDDYKLINMEMRKNCPKLLSFIDEVQRMYTLVPRVIRRVTKNVMFRNYEITPEDLIFGDLNTIFRDPTLFQNPDCFDAYRFLDKSRTKYIPDKNLIPFGLGRRVCLGESLAVMEIFLFISRIIMRYDISLPKETRDNFDKIIEGIYGLVHAPLDHKIIFKVLQQ